MKNALQVRKDIVASKESSSCRFGCFSPDDPKTGDSTGWPAGSSSNGQGIKKIILSQEWTLVACVALLSNL